MQECCRGTTLDPGYNKYYRKLHIVGNYPWEGYASWIRTLPLAVPMVVEIFSTLEHSVASLTDSRMCVVVLCHIWTDQRVCVCMCVCMYVCRRVLFCGKFGALFKTFQCEICNVQEKTQNSLTNCLFCLLWSDSLSLAGFSCPHVHTYTLVCIQFFFRSLLKRAFVYLHPRFWDLGCLHAELFKPIKL